MKRLICLISGQGKTKEQLAREVWEAFQKYQEVSARVNSQPKPHNTSAQEK